MNTEEERLLAALYATWNANTLANALKHRRAEFDPRALDLMELELRGRHTSAQVPASGATVVTCNASPADHREQKEGGANSVRVPYVGAWGIHILLNVAAVFMLGLAFRNSSPRGEIDMAIVLFVLPLLLLFVSLWTFWVIVKWMIVDRLTEQFRAVLKQKDAQPASPPYSEPAPRSPQG